MPACRAPPKRVSFLDPEAVQVAVEGGDIDAAVCDRQTAPVIPRLDLDAARPQLFARPRVERVEDRLGRSRDTARGDVVKPDVGIRLIGVLAVALREDDAVGD